jgi:hypothetical protein
VTTEEPANFTARTLHCLFAKSRNKDGSLMDSATVDTGGVAILSIFNKGEDTRFFSPALVYWEHLYDGRSDFLAEAGSHELGHNLGLSHDGTSDYAYFFVTLTNNGTRFLATSVFQVALTRNFWILDVQTAGEVTLAARPWFSDVHTNGGNVDLKVQLCDSNLNVLHASNPPERLDVEMAVTLQPGLYYIIIINTGLRNKYPRYGSLGQYELSGTLPIKCTMDSDCPDDGLFCTGVPACNAGTCSAAVNPCSSTDLVCNEETDTCEAMATTTAASTATADPNPPHLPL